MLPESASTSTLSVGMPMCMFQTHRCRIRDLSVGGAQYLWHEATGLAAFRGLTRLRIARRSLLKVSRLHAHQALQPSRFRSQGLLGLRRGGCRTPIWRSSWLATRAF